MKFGKTIATGLVGASGLVGQQVGEQMGSPIFVKPPLTHEKPAEYAAKVCEEIKGKFWFNPCKEDVVEKLGE